MAPSLQPRRPALIPWSAMVEHEELPRPARVPREPTDAEYEEAAKRLDLTERRERTTAPPLKTQGRQRIRKVITKLKAQLESGLLSEPDAYDAITNLQLMEDTLKTVIEGR